MGQWVADDIWRKLDPGAGRLSRATARRLLLGSLIGVLVLALLGAVWRSGLVVAQIEFPRYGGGYGWEVGPGQPVAQTLAARNSGLTAVTLLGAGRDMPGMRLTAVEPTFPVLIPPGGEVQLTVRYQVTDCAAVPTDEWPVPVQVQMWWGEQTAYLHVPSQYVPQPEGIAAPVGGIEVQWQAYLAGVSCGRYE
jgi:hypothetical protein